MSFSPPFPGQFGFEGFLASSSMNAINNDIPNCLDKTGDNIGSSPPGGISGQIDVLSGGKLNLLSGAILQFQAGSEVIVGAGTWQFNFGSVILLESGALLDMVSGSIAILGGTNTISGATSVTGAMTFSSTGSLVFATSSTITFNTTQLEGSLNLTGSLEVSTGTIDVSSSAIMTVEGFTSFSGLVGILTGAEFTIQTGVPIGIEAGNAMALGGTTIAGVMPTFSNSGGLTRHYLQSTLTGAAFVSSGFSATQTGIIENNSGGSKWVINLKTHDQAVLTTLGLNYVIADSHSDPGSGNRITMTLYGVDTYGSATTIGSATATGDPAYAAGPQVLTLTGLSTTISNAYTTYNLLFVNENGGSYGQNNIFTNVNLIFSTITSLTWPQ